MTAGGEIRALAVHESPNCHQNEDFYALVSYLFESILLANPRSLSATVVFDSACYCYYDASDGISTT